MTIKINSERPMTLGGPELKRRLALRRIGALAGLTAFGGTSALLGGCGGGGGGNSAPLAAPPQTISPSLGAHSLDFLQIGDESGLAFGGADGHSGVGQHDCGVRRQGRPHLPCRFTDNNGNNTLCPAGHRPWLRSVAECRHGALHI